MAQRFKCRRTGKSRKKRGLWPVRRMVWGGRLRVLAGRCRRGYRSLAAAAASSSLSFSAGFLKRAMNIMAAMM